VQNLQPLQKLRILAFSRDTYNPGYSSLHPSLQLLIEEYYHNRHLQAIIQELNRAVSNLLPSDSDNEEESEEEGDPAPPDNDISSEVGARSDQNWESQHSRRMFKYATSYSELFLNWHSFISESYPSRFRRTRGTI